MGAELGGPTAVRQPPRVTVVIVMNTTALRAPYLPLSVVARSRGRYRHGVPEVFHYASII